MTARGSTTILVFVTMLLAGCSTFDGLVGQKTQSASGSSVATGPASSPTPNSGSPIDTTTTSAGSNTSQAIAKPMGAAAFLLDKSQQQAASSDFAGAADSIEKAMRIEPGNPWINLALAKVRLQQNNAPQAEALAQRALARAKSDSELNRQCWLVVSDARQLRGDANGAADARSRAAQW